MGFVVIGIVILGVIFGPQFWVKQTMKRHGVERPDLPGTGGELAEHLIETFNL